MEIFWRCVQERLPQVVMYVVEIVFQPLTIAAHLPVWVLASCMVSKFSRCTSNTSNGNPSALVYWYFDL